MRFHTVSMKFVGIGVVVAGVVATVAVGGYMMREPVRPAVSALVIQPEPVSPEPVSAVLQPPAPVAITTDRPVRTATRVAAEQPVAVQTSTPTPSPAPEPAPQPAVPQPTAPTPPRYVPEPADVPTPSPAPVVETVEPEAPAVPHYDELTVERHAVIGIRLDYSVSTRTAKVEDRIAATVSRNVMVRERVAIPEGARLEGTVTMVDRGGKFRERPRLGLQFDTMILTDGTRMSIRTDAIIREGDSPSADAAAKVGAGSAVGAILGGLLGGKKGAIIGGAAGAATGTASVMHGDGNETALKAGAPLTVRLTEDLVVQVRRQ